MVGCNLAVARPSGYIGADSEYPQFMASESIRDIKNYDASEYAEEAVILANKKLQEIVGKGYSTQIPEDPGEAMEVSGLLWTATVLLSPTYQDLPILDVTVSVTFNLKDLNSDPIIEVYGIDIQKTLSIKQPIVSLEKARAELQKKVAQAKQILDINNAELNQVWIPISGELHKIYFARQQDTEDVNREKEKTDGFSARYAYNLSTGKIINFSAIKSSGITNKKNVMPCPALSTTELWGTGKYDNLLGLAQYTVSPLTGTNYAQNTPGDGQNHVFAMRGATVKQTGTIPGVESQSAYIENALQDDLRCITVATAIDNVSGAYNTVPLLYSTKGVWGANQYTNTSLSWAVQHDWQSNDGSSLPPVVSSNGQNIYDPNWDGYYSGVDIAVNASIVQNYLHDTFGRFGVLGKKQFVTLITDTTNENLVSASASAITHGGNNEIVFNAFADDKLPGSKPHIIYHELGHLLDYNNGGYAYSMQNPNNSSNNKNDLRFVAEGFADWFSLLVSYYAGKTKNLSFLDYSDLTNPPLNITADNSSKFIHSHFSYLMTFGIGYDGKTLETYYNFANPSKSNTPSANALGMYYPAKEYYLPFTTVDDDSNASIGIMRYALYLLIEGSAPCSDNNADLACDDGNELATAFLAKGMQGMKAIKNGSMDDAIALIGQLFYNTSVAMKQESGGVDNAAVRTYFATLFHNFRYRLEDTALKAFGKDKACADVAECREIANAFNGVNVRYPKAGIKSTSLNTSQTEMSITGTYDYVEKPARIYFKILDSNGAVKVQAFTEIAAPTDASGVKGEVASPTLALDGLHSGNYSVVVRIETIDPAACIATMSECYSPYPRLNSETNIKTDGTAATFTLASDVPSSNILPTIGSVILADSNAYPLSGTAASFSGSALQVRDPNNTTSTDPADVYFSLVRDAIYANYTLPAVTAPSTCAGDQCARYDIATKLDTASLVNGAYDFLAVAVNSTQASSAPATALLPVAIYNEYALEQHHETYDAKHNQFITDPLFVKGGNTLELSLSGDTRTGFTDPDAQATFFITDFSGTGLSTRLDVTGDEMESEGAYGTYQAPTGAYAESILLLNSVFVDSAKQATYPDYSQNWIYQVTDLAQQIAEALGIPVQDLVMQGVPFVIDTVAPLAIPHDGKDITVQVNANGCVTNGGTASTATLMLEASDQRVMLPITLHLKSVVFEVTKPNSTITTINGAYTPETLEENADTIPFTAVLAGLGQQDAGTYTVKAIITDSAGNTYATPEQTFDVKVAKANRKAGIDDGSYDIDCSAPTITFTNYSIPDQNQPVLQVDFSVTDNQEIPADTTVEVTFYPQQTSGENGIYGYTQEVTVGSAVSTTVNQETGAYTYTFDVKTPLLDQAGVVQKDDQYTVQVKVEDAVGNKTNLYADLNQDGSYDTQTIDYYAPLEMEYNVISGSCYRYDASGDMVAYCESPVSFLIGARDLGSYVNAVEFSLTDVERNKTIQDWMPIYEAAGGSATEVSSIGTESYTLSGGTYNYAFRLHDGSSDSGEKPRTVIHRLYIDEQKPQIGNMAINSEDSAFYHSEGTNASWIKVSCDDPHEMYVTFEAKDDTVIRQASVAYWLYYQGTSTTVSTNAVAIDTVYHGDEEWTIYQAHFTNVPIEQDLQIRATIIDGVQQSAQKDMFVYLWDASDEGWNGDTCEDTPADHPFEEPVATDDDGGNDGGSSGSSGDDNGDGGYPPIECIAELQYPNEGYDTETSPSITSVAYDCTVKAYGSFDYVYDTDRFDVYLAAGQSYRASVYDEKTRKYTATWSFTATDPDHIGPYSFEMTCRNDDGSAADCSGYGYLIYFEWY